MKSKFLNSKALFSLFIMLVIFCNITTVFGQQIYTTKIKDGSVPGSANTAYQNALLELESNSKGFLLPRMTTAEREAISITDREKGNGLVIYNKQTDCINYYSKIAKKWLSLCGEVPPAIADLANCNKISVSPAGNAPMLEQGKSLVNTDLVYVSVDVLEAGTFSISATTNNGYSFSKSGVFESPGIYTVALEGLGTPIAGNPTNGDDVTFYINGKETQKKCPTFKIKVQSTIIEYDVKTSGNVNVTWDAFIGVPLSATKNNTVSISVDVKTIGYWRIKTNTSNGMSFQGSGEFTTLGTQTITIIGQGTPETSTPVAAPTVFTITTNSSQNSTPNLTISVNVKAPAYELICNDTNRKIEVRGEYFEGTKLNKTHSVVMPVKVLAPGLVTITASGSFSKADGTSTTTEFKGENIRLNFNDSQGDIQYVTLFAKENEVIPKGSTKLTFTQINPGGLPACSNFPVQEVKKRPSQYNIYCNTARYFGDYQVKDFSGNTVAPDLNDGNHYLEVQVSVGVVSDYSMETTTIDGVKFKGSGTFTSTGTQTVRLMAEGPAFVVGGVKNFVITTDTAEGNATCSAPLDVSYREIVVLTLGSTLYGPGTNQAYAATAILKSSQNFGPNGTVKVKNLTVLNTHAHGASLETFLNTNKVDIVFNVIGYSFTSATIDVLTRFVNSGGVVIIGDENTAHSGTMNFLKAVSTSSTGSMAANGRYTMINNVINDATDPIVNGPFGSLAGKQIGNDATNGWYYSGLPSDYKPLIYKDSSTDVWGLRHNTKGVAFFGDGGWPIGTRTSKHTAIYPSMFDVNGKPEGKPYYQGATVYNALLYANVMAWAIEYVKINKK
jgi:hypothetical protein